MVPRLSYVICSSPRSGSSILAGGLWSTNIAGKPAEYFNPGLLHEMRVGIALGISDDSQYLEKMIDASATDNGVFGTKLHAFHTAFFLQKVSEHRGEVQSSLREAMESEFPNVRYIYLRRDNKIAQAISYYRAMRTSEWWRFSGKKTAHIEPEAYYEPGIRKLLAQVLASDAYWEGFFEKHKITPLKLTFDDVSQDYENAVRRTLDFLGLDTKVAINPPRTLRISDEVTEEWEARFRKSKYANPHVEVPKQWAPY